MEEENVSVKAIHQNDEVLEFNITCYNFKELCASAFELIKRSLMFIILILINLRVLYSALPFLLYCLLYFTIPTPFYLVFRLYIIILIFCWVFVMIAGGLYLRRYTKDL